MENEEFEEPEEFPSQKIKIEKKAGGIYKPSPAEFFKSTYDWLKTIGKVGSSIIFFAIIALFGLLAGKHLFLILGLFYIFSIILRIPDTYCDVFYFESIATFALILTFVAGQPVAIFFALTAEWLTKFVSPFGPVEDYQETFSESTAVAAAILLITLVPFSGNLLIYMISFHAIRFAVFYLMIAITSPATFFHDLIQGTAIVPLSIIQSYIILMLLGGWVLNLYGIAGWSLPTFQSLFVK